MLPDSPLPRGRRARGLGGTRRRHREAEEISQVPGEFDHDHALPFFGVCAGDNRDRHDTAPVHRQMRRTRWDVHEIPGTHDGSVEEPVAVPDFGLATHSVKGGFMVGMKVRHPARSWRNHGQVQAQCRG